MVARVNLKKDDEPSLSPEREALAQAAQKYVHVQREHAGCVEAQCRCWTLLGNLGRQIDQADLAIHTAEEAFTKFAIAMAMGEDVSEPSPTVAEARQLHAELKIQYDAARSVQDTLMIKEGEIGMRLELSNAEIRRCVAAVVKADPATRALLDQLAFVRSKFVTLNQAVEYLAANGMVPDGTSPVLATDSKLESEWRAGRGTRQGCDPPAAFQAKLAFSRSR
jgi:hypothetical protein